MAAFEVITHEKFSSFRFRKSKHFFFASTDALCPISAAEIIPAALHTPIAFTETESGFDLVTVQGIEPMQNLFVGVNGEWLGDFLPSLYRAYPFLLAALENKQEVLCFDVESGLLSENEDDQAFFMDDGLPATPINEALNFLAQVSASRKATQAMCLMLSNLNLIQDWPISINFDGNIKRNVEGLFRIDEARLNDLADDAFLQLRRSGALPLVYCQLLSMRNFENLLKLSIAKSSQPKSDIAGLGFELDSPSGSLNFDSL